jgi:hypothetical protein
MSWFGLRQKGVRWEQKDFLTPAFLFHVFLVQESKASERLRPPHAFGSELALTRRNAVNGRVWDKATVSPSLVQAHGMNCWIGGPLSPLSYLVSNSQIVIFKLPGLVAL